MRLIDAAVEAGIPVPRTRIVAGSGQLQSAIGGIEYPVVVKPCRSRIRTADGWVAAGVHYAHSERELRRIYRDTPYLGFAPSLIQERIVGAGTGVFVLFDRGRLLAGFAHRRLREKPPAGGASVLCESVPLAPALRDQAIRLLGPRRWHGVAMLEYKHDVRRGIFFLIEVNGRFWGSLQLAIDAGVDFPYLACELARGRRPAGPGGYWVGVRSRWFLGDLDHLLLRLFRRNGDHDLPPSAPSRLRAIVDFLYAGRGVRNEVARHDDLRPFLYELSRAARDLASSSLARVSIAAEKPACSQPQDEFESRELAG
jgi:predicted ATP-grasp superfamily ATP-dependent carboligase